MPCRLCRENARAPVQRSAVSRLAPSIPIVFRLLFTMKRSAGTPAAISLSKTLLNHGFSLSKQKADNASDDGIENRADHHAAHSAEQHEDVGLTKQHPDRQSPDEGAEDAGNREALGKPDVTSLTHVCCAAAHGDRRNFSTKNLVSITNDIFEWLRFQIGKPQADNISLRYQPGGFVEWAGCTTRPLGIAERVVSFSASLFVRCA